MKSKLILTGCIIVGREGEVKNIIDFKGECNHSKVTDTLFFHKETTIKGDVTLFKIRYGQLQVELNGYAVIPRELLTEDQMIALHKHNKS